MADRETIELAAVAEASAKRKVTNLSLQNLVYAIGVVGSVFIAYANIKAELGNHTDQINRIENIQTKDHTSIEEIQGSVKVLLDRTDPYRRGGSQSERLDKDTYGSAGRDSVWGNPVSRGGDQLGAYRPDQSKTR